MLERPGPYRIAWCVPIPMRDGVTLNATIYHPLPGERSRPVVLTITPYLSDTYHDRGKALAQRGFIVAIVDARGRGSSGGEFAPMRDGRDDGYDCIEWLGSAPFCDGTVVMWGGSYAGMNQWLAASQRPPHLKAIAPAACALMGYDMPFRGGIYSTWTMQWLTLTSGRGAAFNAVDDSAYWRDTFLRCYRDHRPFAELAGAVGNTTTVWPAWIAHQQLDAYWDEHNPRPEELAAIELPVLTITGHYDDCCVSSLELYRRHIGASPAAARRHDVIIGPWDHAGTRTPRRRVGDLTLGPQSVIDLNVLHAQWYAWATADAPRPALLQDRITYYVTGLEEWRSAPTLDAVTTSEWRLNLHAPAGGAADAFVSGRLDDDGEGSEPQTYTYDPLDTRPGDVTAPIDVNRPLTLSDQTAALNLFGNGLVYHSAPLAADILLAGMPAIDLYISMNVRDTDLKVALYQILPDGTSVILGEDMLRARYRHSLREAQLVTPGTIERYRFERLTWSARLIVKYSRLRLVVACPNSIYEQKNYNSGGDVMRESAADAHIAHITVHHRHPHASVLALPLGTIATDRRLDDAVLLPYVIADATVAPQG